MEDKWRERGCSGGVKDSWGGGGGRKPVVKESWVKRAQKKVGVGRKFGECKMRFERITKGVGTF